MMRRELHVEALSTWQETTLCSPCIARYRHHREPVTLSILANHIPEAVDVDLTQRATIPTTLYTAKAITAVIKRASRSVREAFQLSRFDNLIRLVGTARPQSGYQTVINGKFFSKARFPSLQ